MPQNPAELRDGFHPCLCFNLRQAARRVSSFYDAHMAKAGLTATQFALLVEVAMRNGTPISEIAERLGLDPSTLSRTLRPLEIDGLLEIFADPKNRRLRLVRLTGEGRGRLREGVQAWQAAQTAAMAAIPEGLVQALLEGTGRLPDIAHAGKPKRRRLPPE